MQALLISLWKCHKYLVLIADRKVREVTWVCYWVRDGEDEAFGDRFCGPYKYKSPKNEKTAGHLA